MKRSLSMVESRRASRPYLSNWWQDLGLARSKHCNFRDGHSRVSVVFGEWWIFHMRGVEVLLCTSLFRTCPLVRMACKVSFEVSIESTVNLRKFSFRSAQNPVTQASDLKEAESSPHRNDTHDTEILKKALRSFDVMSKSMCSIHQIQNQFRRQKSSYISK